MVNQEILDYINKARASGQTDDQIKAGLVSAGWSEAEANEAISIVQRKQSLNHNLYAPLTISKNESTIKEEFLPAKKPKKWTKVIICLVVLLLIGAGIFIWQRYFNKSNSVSQSPQTSQSPQILPPDQTSQSPQVSQFPSEGLINKEKEETLAETPVNVLKDCQNDFNCLIERGRQCALAKGENTASFSLAGAQIQPLSQIEIKGGTTQSCNIQVKVKKVNLTFPAGAPPVSVNFQTALYKSFEGKQINCVFETDKLLFWLDRLGSGAFDINQIKCQPPKSGKTTCLISGGTCQF